MEQQRPREVINASASKIPTIANTKGDLLMINFIMSLVIFLHPCKEMRLQI